MRNYYFILVACFALSLTSCGEDASPETVIEPTPAQPEEKTELKVTTRATESSFENSDAIGIYVANYVNDAATTLKSSGNTYDNMKFTFNDAGWAAAQTLYWENTNTMADVYGYYPYGTVTDATAYTFELQPDQSSEASYKASDFLWGKAEGQSARADVNLTLKHLFCKMVITIKAGDGFTEEELNSSDMSVAINNVKTKALIDLSNGSVTATGNGMKVNAYMSGTSSFQAYVVPQTVEQTGLITVTMNGNDYTLTRGMTFQSNKTYKFTITLSKTSSGINVNIGSWGETDEDYGGTVS